MPLLLLLHPGTIALVTITIIITVIHPETGRTGTPEKGTVLEIEKGTEKEIVGVRCQEKDQHLKGL